MQGVATAKVQTTLRFDEGLMERAKDKARKIGEPLTAVIERLLGEWLERGNDAPPSASGKVGAGK